MANENMSFLEDRSYLEFATDWRGAPRDDSLIDIHNKSKAILVINSDLELDDDLFLDAIFGLCSRDGAALLPLLIIAGDGKHEDEPGQNFERLKDKVKTRLHPSDFLIIGVNDAATPHLCMSYKVVIMRGCSLKAPKVCDERTKDVVNQLSNLIGDQRFGLVNLTSFTLLQHIPENLRRQRDFVLSSCEYIFTPSHIILGANANFDKSAYSEAKKMHDLDVESRVSQERWILSHGSLAGFQTQKLAEWYWWGEYVASMDDLDMVASSPSILIPAGHDMDIADAGRSQSYTWRSVDAAIQQGSKT